MKKDVYFERYAYQEAVFRDVAIPEDTRLIVTIPSYNEPAVELAVASLFNCRLPPCSVLILVLINEPEEASASVSNSNQKSLDALSSLEVPAGFQLTFQRHAFTAKKAGVGLARKVLMDEAARLFARIEANGVIVCFDADCTCSDNFLTEVHAAFEDTGTKAAITFFEHPLDNPEIIQYELFLRYYISGLRYAGFPYAHQTLGSCMAVRSDIYKRQGGMNTRKAGEDFYFLHKVIALGDFREINSATVFPSSRVSNRVPFGTGHAIEKIKALEVYTVYDPRGFEDLKAVFSQVRKYYVGEEFTVPRSVDAFYRHSDFSEDLVRIRTSSNSFSTFQQHFFGWWDGFKVLKYIHFARDNYYPNVALELALEALDSKYWQLSFERANDREKLEQIRSFDRAFGPVK